MLLFIIILARLLFSIFFYDVILWYRISIRGVSNQLMLDAQRAAPEILRRLNSDRIPSVMTYDIKIFSTATMTSTKYWISAIILPRYVYNSILYVLKRLLSFIDKILCCNDSCYQIINQQPTTHFLVKLLRDLGTNGYFPIDYHLLTASQARCQ